MRLRAAIGLDATAGLRDDPTMAVETNEGVQGARIAKVLIPLPLPEGFDYAEPGGMGLARGDMVAVPLGPRMTRGVVLSLADGAGLNRSLKSVAGRLEDPPLPPHTLDFVLWAARYAVDVPGAPLAMALRGLNGPRPKARRRLVAVEGSISPSTEARRRALAAAAAPIARGDLRDVAGVSDAVIKALLDQGALKVVEEPAEEVFSEPNLDRPGAPLNASQAAAAATLSTLVAERCFAVALLDGVTGSGKTEVYMEAAAEALAQDPEAQVLVLLPEIALTQAVIQRFTERFGAPPVEWHSGVSPVRRRAAWEAVATGRARIVVGARSALFLPFRRIALIVVDEEHDASYKQEEGFIYQARDFAVARAKIENCAAILASATPSLESIYNAEAGRYSWMRLIDRHGMAEMPRIELVDLRATPPGPGQWLSPPLAGAVAQTLLRGEQALLFLNRRGYAPLVLCRSCGERMRAPDTDSWLV